MNSLRRLPDLANLCYRYFLHTNAAAVGIFTVFPSLPKPEPHLYLSASSSIVREFYTPRFLACQRIVETVRLMPKMLETRLIEKIQEVQVTYIWARVILYSAPTSLCCFRTHSGTKAATLRVRDPIFRRGPWELFAKPCEYAGWCIYERGKGFSRNHLLIN